MRGYWISQNTPRPPYPNYHPLLEAAATSCPPPLLHIAQAVFLVPGALGLTLPRVITFEEETNTSQYLSSLPPVLIASRPVSKVRSHRMLKRDCNYNANYKVKLGRRWLAHQNSCEISFLHISKNLEKVCEKCC